MQWVNLEQLKEHRKIELGYNPITLNPFHFNDNFMGDAFLVCGITSYGKSLLTGNMIVELAKSRRVLIFDYKGDYRNLKYVNFHNRQKRFDSIPDLVYVHKFGFKLQDFTNPFDWKMLGMEEKAAVICASKAKMALYHRNDFEKFRELIEEIIVSGNKDKVQAWWQTKKSILMKLDSIKYCFVGSDAIDITDKDAGMIRYTGKPFYVSDWKRFIKRHKHICLNLNSEYSSAKAQLFAGKILNEIEPVMDELNLVIPIEEAHKLVPANIDENDLPYSLFKILHYLKELHKKGVKIILITQYPHQIQEEALDEIKRFFFGKLQNVKGSSKLDEMFKLSSALNFNFYEEYREFWHYSPLYGEREIFVPYDSVTYYEKRK